MYLLDTNVLSELPRPRPSPSVLRFLAERHEFAISVVTIEEIVFGIARAGATPRRKLAAWFDALMETGIHVYDVTAPIARASAELRAAREGAGRRVAQADMLIAATVLVHGLTLATRNLADFEGCGIVLFDPFRA
jgi:predicted nucleic acid-binding protein